MFESLEKAAPDAILGLTDSFREDPNPQKINLTVGVYRDANGTTPILHCVKQAEQRLVDDEASKSYLPIDGNSEYGKQVQQLVFGPDHEVIATGRATTVQTPGGTGAVRVAADFIKSMYPAARIWCSDPTWANHPNIFDAAGLERSTYPYLDASANSLNFQAMLSALSEIPPGDAVLLHASCHNPTGVDPSTDQWRQIAEVIAQRQLLPLVDFAYQGFGDGLSEDATGVAELCRANIDALICSSYSKNFSLYRERVGALTVVATAPAAAQIALSQVKRCVRANYSNPPAHGASIVSTVLSDDGLRKSWLSDLTGMRDRINGMRKLFVNTMKTKSPDHDMSFISQQRGMFSFSGLSPEQVDTLREKHSIYIVRSGRINVAGMTESNMECICDAIASVL